MAQFKPSAVDGVDDPRINEVVLSTGNINQKYIVRDIVFVAECIEGTYSTLHSIVMTCS